MFVLNEKKLYDVKLVLFSNKKLIFVFPFKKIIIHYNNLSANCRCKGRRSIIEQKTHVKTYSFFSFRSLFAWIQNWNRN